jgi:hypothetical protein
MLRGPPKMVSRRAGRKSPGPDIYTAPTDRDRAIVLRWVLRDTKANRLNLSPVDQRDLLDLIDMGLVEIRNDVPLLTSAGDNAII